MSDLEGLELDCAVARFLGVEPGDSYSSNWSYGGPVIEAARISIWRYDESVDDTYGRDVWHASGSSDGVHGWDDGSLACDFEATGPTALIAAMRAFVASHQ